MRCVPSGSRRSRWMLGQPAERESNARIRKPHSFPTSQRTATRMHQLQQFACGWIGRGWTMRILRIFIGRFGAGDVEKIDGQIKAPPSVWVEVVEVITNFPPSPKSPCWHNVAKIPEFCGERRRRIRLAGPWRRKSLSAKRSWWTRIGARRSKLASDQLRSIERRTIGNLGAETSRGAAHSKSPIIGTNDGAASTFPDPQVGPSSPRTRSNNDACHQPPTRATQGLVFDRYRTHLNARP